jgi:hypothetical protein
MRQVFTILFCITIYSCSNSNLTETKSSDTLVANVEAETSLNYSLQPSHIELPYLGNETFDKVTKGKTIKNLKYFGLRGKIKSLSETENLYRSDDTISDVMSEKAFLFNEEGRLTLFVEGDTNVFQRSLVEHYYYDSMNKLSKISSKSNSWNDINLTISEYDTAGYLINETLRFISGYTGEDVLYHYKVIYNYTDDYASLDLKFQPITRVFHSEDEITSYRFQFDSLGNYIRPGIKMAFDKPNRPISYFIDYGCGQNSGLCVYVFIKYDHRGNIAELKIDDKTTRNALLTASQHYKAKYNDHDLLIEKTHSTGNYGKSNNDNVPLTYEYEFDNIGNWIVMKTYRDTKLLSTMVREITYYL